MSLSQDVRRLAAVAPFSALPREAVQIIAFSSERILLKAGHHLFLGSARSDAGYFVLSGALDLRAGKRTKRVEADTLIGETALIAEVQRRYEASAVEDCELLRIPRLVFRRVLEEFPAAKKDIRGSLRLRAGALVAPLEAAGDGYFAPQPRKRG
jgi:CRP-like cAMP-binding protein